MNLEILLCLCFVCEIVMCKGYWTRPETKNLNWTRSGVKYSRWYEFKKDKGLASRRLYDVSDRPDVHSDTLIAMNSSLKQSLSMEKVNIRKRGRDKKPVKKKPARQDDDNNDLQKKPSSVLSSAILTPFSLKRQLKEILEQIITPMNSSIEVIGRTAEYNEILLIKMSSKTNNLPRVEEDEFVRRKNIKYEDNVAKKLIFIVHNLNPIGADSLGYLKEIGLFMKLIDMYSEELTRFDIFLIPVANPDGFSIDAPFWYKNVSPQEGGFGVNLDYNFDVAWKDTVENTLSQFYPGPTAFSEPETRAIRDIFFRYNHNMIAYLNIHASSYGPEFYKGDAILYPKGYTETTTNDDRYLDLRGDIDEALRNASLHLYSMTVDTLYSWYGKVTGKSVDYASSIYGIPFSLEICMQAYDIREKDISELVLLEVWRRVFKVIFNNIEKSLHKDEHMRRYNDPINK